MLRSATVLLIDEDGIHAQRLLDYLRLRRHRTMVCNRPAEAIRLLSRRDYRFDVLIVNVSRSYRDCLRTLRLLRDTYRQSHRHPGPAILCTSAVYRGPQFKLDIERMGARLVYER